MYSEVRVIPCLEPGKIAHVALHDIPVESLWVKNETFRQSYNSIRVFLLNIVRAGKAESISGGSPIIHPTHSDMLNSHWAYHWDYIYNTDAIEEYKLETEERLRSYLFDPHDYRLVLPQDEFDFGCVVRCRPCHLVPKVFPFWLLSRRFVLASYCWTALVLRLHVLRTSP